MGAGGSSLDLNVNSLRVLVPDEPPPALTLALNKTAEWRDEREAQAVQHSEEVALRVEAAGGPDRGPGRLGNALVPREPDQGFGRKAFITPPEGGAFLLSGAMKGRQLTLATLGGIPVMNVVFSFEAGNEGILFRSYDGRPLAILSLDHVDEGRFHLFTHGRRDDEEGKVVAVFRLNLKSLSVHVYETPCMQNPMGVLRMDHSGHKGSLQGRSGELLATFSVHKPAPPLSLFVGVPESLSKYGGRYELVGRVGADGQPAWKASSSNRWLYSGSDGRWYLADGDVKRRSFCCSIGVARSAAGHRGVWPDLCGGPWERLDDQRGGSGGWVLDSSIVVASTSDAQEILSALQAQEEEVVAFTTYRCVPPCLPPCFSHFTAVDEGPCRMIRTAPGVDIGVAVCSVLPLMATGLRLGS